MKTKAVSLPQMWTAGNWICGREFFCYFLHAELFLIYFTYASDGQWITSFLLHFECLPLQCMIQHPKLKILSVLESTFDFWDKLECPKVPHQIKNCLTSVIMSCLYPFLRGKYQRFTSCFTHQNLKEQDIWSTAKEIQKQLQVQTDGGDALSFYFYFLPTRVEMNPKIWQRFMLMITTCFISGKMNFREMPGNYQIHFFKIVQGDAKEIWK